ncbi:RNA12 protein-domain-containing protein [Pisolithus croceorrhizus]|nr:RNA12 protein-domain-containing protein [Pisolithus croceorrhizus]
MLTRHVARLGTRALLRGTRTFTDANATTREAWLFVDSVFPIRLGIWDIRYYVGILREESLLDNLETRLSAVNTHGFKVLSLEPYPKDGGVFVHFSYAAHETEEHAMDAIESDVKDEIDRHGGMPSWLGLSRGSVWLVKGRPWREDMNRYPSTLVKVAFEGPDIREETLYHLYRPYGRIYNITPPTPVPSGMLRFSQIAFQRVRSATVARNVTHGFHLPKEGSVTRLLTTYERPLQAHAIRDWITGHPRIFLPILFFLLGTLTYTIFDPIRTLFVEGKMLNRFDFREYDIYKWLCRQALDRLVLRQEDVDDGGPDQDVWQERRAAEVALRSYLADLPGTVALVHGPQGSGKWRMVSTVIRDTGRKALVIDYAELNKAPSDSRLVAALAQQTGYRPIFTFLNSLNNLIDIATMGVIGQKAGLSSSLQDQLKQILEVVGTALRRVSRRLQNEVKQRIEAERQAETRRECEIRMREAIREGIWHDPRLDAVVGIGVISELGVGDEPLNGLVISSSESKDAGALESEERRRAAEGELARKERSMKETRTIESLPVVVIKNYAARGRTNRQELQEVLSQWAATLIENQVAHVVVISENRENAKLLARALPSKPLNFIALSDADVQSALSFVKKRLRDAVVTFELTPEQTACVERLGGRASDLESLIHKVHSGQSIEDAVEDIISRAVSELRKNAFGEDTDEAKMLPWSREQVWTVLKRLSQKPELPYYQTLVDFPFKGDETPLRAMENAELISIVILNGRPSTIRPGRPVLKYVFQQLVHDPVFQATQDLALNQILISSAETTVKSCESELNTLQEMAIRESWTQRLWGIGRGSAERTRYLARKMYAAQQKIQTLEKQNAELRRVLDKPV